MKTKLPLVFLVACALATAFFLGRATSPSGTGRGAGRETAVTPPPERRPPPSVDLPGPGRNRQEPRAPAAGVQPRPGAPAVKGPPPPPGFVTGVVSLDDGASPGGVKVLLTGPDALEREQELDGSGEIRFDDLGPGRYKLQATHPDYAPQAFQFEVMEGHGAGPFPIRLKKGGAVRVRVLGGRKEPLVGERVILQDDNQRALEEAETDGAGEALFEKLAPGPYYVKRGIAMRTVTVIPGREELVVFEVSCELSGTVFGMDGAPLAQAIVRLTPAKFGKEGYRSLQTRTGDGGRYVFRGFPPGEYGIKVQVVGRRGPDGRRIGDSYAVQAGTVELAPGQVMDHPVRLPQGTLSGRVTRADTGAPLSNRDVQITARRVEVEGGKVTKRLGRSSMAFADKDGHYRFVGLAPGHYQIWIAARKPDLGDIWHLEDFGAGGERQGVDFAVPSRKLGTLRLKVLEPDGSGAGGLYFVVHVGDMSRTLHGKQVGAGLYEFQMEVGERIVSAFRKGFAADKLTVTIPEGKTVEAEIQLRRSEPN